MTNVPDGAQMSDDGQSWWDGTQWVAVAPSSVPVADSAGSSSLDTPTDWNEYPELVRATTYGVDIDAYLLDIGVDPTRISDPGIT